MRKCPFSYYITNEITRLNQQQHEKWWKTQDGSTCDVTSASLFL